MNSPTGRSSSTASPPEKGPTLGTYNLDENPVVGAPGLIVWASRAAHAVNDLDTRVVSTDDVTAAMAAAEAAQAAAEAAAAQAAVVGNTNDTIMTAVGANSASSFAKQLAAMYVRVVSPVAYGAAADDTADDTSAVQSAISAAATFGLSVDLRGLTYKTTDQLNLPAGAVLMNGTIHCTGTAKKIVSITASNVRVTNVTIIGRHSVATAASNEYGIFVGGASAGAPISNITVDHCTIALVGMYGIYHQYVNNFSVERNHIRDLGYAGYAGLSVSNGEIVGNYIHDILAGFSANGYGITLTRTSSDSLTTDPRSTDVIISRNRIVNIPWEGIDTHGGRNITVANNDVFGCLVGIAMVGAVSAGGINIAPLNVNVIGNTVDSKVSNGTIGHAISIAGAPGADNSASAESATGQVIGNTIIGCGLESSSVSGAVRLRDTSGFLVSGNLIIEPSPHGIIIANTNFGVTVIGNTIVDHWSSSVSIASAVYIQSTYNDGIISANLHRNAGKKAAATYKNERGLNVGTATNNAFQAVGNLFSSATIPYNGTATVVSNRPGVQTFYQGTVSAPGLAFGSDGATGFYPIGTSDFGLAMAGVRKLRFLATSMTVEDGYNIAFGGTSGTKLGLGATHKLGLWGATPVVQPAAIANSTDSSDAATKLNSLLAALRSVGIIAP
ncbi:right-handed parallel beta-helix repeat-containing protein [Microbacterium sp. 22242]|uniref:right-handed parallel beta-helix repeat-containing protein n=1 Tax=Microbacterium sp. 22242 TaxID=3453896 RepID=UPI003F871BDE